MSLNLGDKPFKNREDILAEIERNSRAERVCIILCLIFLALGIISNVSNTKLGLDSTSWLLMAVVFVVANIPPQIHLVSAKHLLGMEIIKKDKE
jgi:hypothetical protein